MRRPSIGDRQASELSQSVPQAQLTDRNEARPPSSESQSAARIVRPSDIYARMEQEKERVRRQSEDSNRPSLDTSDRAHTRAEPVPQMPIEQPTGPVELDAGSRPKPALDPVAERKSEYGFDGLIQANASTQATKSSTFDLSAPSLPQLGRFSSFGTDLLNPADFGVESSNKGVMSGQAPSRPPAVDTGRKLPKDDPSLHNQPSLGFRSAVEHAFERDGSATASSPTTGINSPRSARDSDISRSNTDSTAGISPIMSRVPSAGAAKRRAQEREMYQNMTSPIKEATRETGSPDSRPTSSGTLRPLAQDNASRHSREMSAESAVTAVKPGYRRDQNVPSPASVPHHTPALETNRDMNRSDEAQIATATPVDVSFNQTPGNIATRIVDANAAEDSPTSNYSTSNYSRRESDLAERARSEPTSAGIGREAAAEQASFIQTHPKISTSVAAGDNESSRPGSSPRPNSPSKGRVRDLASRYNEIHDSRRNSNASPSSSISSWASSPRRTNSTGLDSAFPATADKSHTNELSEASDRGALGLEPPSRPRLPGEWVSYAASTSSGRNDGSQDDGNGRLQGIGEYTNSQDATPRVASPVADEDVDLSPATKKESLVGRSLEGANNPMAAVAAAGSAIADSLKQSVGIGRDAPHDEARDSDSSDDMITPDTRDRTIGVLSNRSPERGQEYFRAYGDNAEARDSSRNRGGPSSSMKPILPAEMDIDGSQDTSDQESENEALTKDIVRSLTPQRPTPSPSRSPGRSTLGESTVSNEPPAATESSTGYDRHAVESSTAQAPDPLDTERGRGSDDLGFDPDFGPTRLDGPYISEGRTAPAAVKPQSSAIAKPALDKRFSWEQSHERAPSVGPSELASPDTAPAHLTELSPSPMEYPDYTDKPTIDTSLRSAGQDAAVKPSMPDGGGVSTASPATPSGVRKASHALPSSNVPAFKEILSQKNPRDRIQSFDRARNHFATVHTGMTDWLTYMIQAHPEHIQGGAAAVGSNVDSNIAGSARSRFAHGQQATSGALSGVTASPATTDSPSRIRGPAQIKGKELYHSAAVLSGRATSKATTGAKGLFAKGKSRFRNVSTEKVD